MSSPLWEKCLSHLEDDLSAQQLNTWLRPLQAIETKSSLRLLAPNSYVQAWVQEQLEQTMAWLAVRETRTKSWGWRATPRMWTSRRPIGS